LIWLHLICGRNGKQIPTTAGWATVFWVLFRVLIKPISGSRVIVMKIGVGLGSACFIANFAKGKTRSKLGPLHQAIAESFGATETACASGWYAHIEETFDLATTFHVEDLAWR